MLQRTSPQTNTRNLSLVLLLVLMAFEPLVVVFALKPALAQTPTTSFSPPNVVPNGTTIKVDGSSSMATINLALKKAYEEKYAGTSVTLAEKGSDTALKALVDGKIDLAAIGRALTTEEKQQGLVAAPITRRKIAIIVDPNNPFVGNISFEQFAKIFRGEIKDWSELGGTPGAIRFVDRPTFSDTRQAFNPYPVFQKAPFKAGEKSQQTAKDSTDEVIQALGTDGIGYAIANQVLDRKDVRVVSMHKTLPDDARYPFSQPLAYVYKGTPSAAVVSFLSVATAPASRSIIEAAREGTAVDASPVPISSSSSVSPASSSPASATATPDVAAVPPEASTEARGAFPWWLLLIPLLGALLWFWLKGRRTESAPDVPPTAAVPPDRPPTLPIPTPPISTPPIAPPTPETPVLETPVLETPVLETPVLETPVTVSPGASIADGATLAAGAGIVGLTTGIGENAVIEPPTVIEPMAAIEPPVVIAPPIVVAPVAAIDPPFVVEPIAAIEPPVVVESIAAIEPAIIIDPSVVVDPPVVVAPIAAIDLPLQAMPSEDSPSVDTASAANLSDMGITGAAVLIGGAAIGAGLAAGVGNQAQSSVAVKDHVGQADLSSETLASVDEGLPDLPDGYGESRIVLMPRDPQWGYAYWDVPNEQREDRRQEGGQRLALRLYDVTDVDVNHHAHSLQQYDCDELARDWYVPIPVSDRDYIAEIGYLTADGRWLLLARSNPVRIPPVYPADGLEDQFISVMWDEDLRGSTLIELLSPAQRTPVSDSPLYDQNDPFGMAQSAEALRTAGSLFSSIQQMPSQTVSSYVPAGVGLGAAPGLLTSGLTMSGIGMSGIGMSGIGLGAMPALRTRKFWLVADAELIVYGATEPDATVTIDGRPIQLNPDGTFRFQMSFQDGVLNFPILAIAADGEQSRSIHMTFDRETPHRQTNTKDEAVDEWMGG